MALRTYLTGIADAIREKKGTTDPINAQDFASEIASISTGGGGENPLRTLIDGKRTYGGYYLCHSYQGDNVDFLNGIDFSATTDMSYMFYNCSNLISISQLNTSNVKNMMYMFTDCTKLTTIPQLDTSKVTEMKYMFYNCVSLPSIPQLDTSKATSISFAFSGCYKLTNIPPLDTGSATNMKNMFANCYNLPTIDITKLADNNKSFALYCYSLTKLIIRTMETIPTFGSLMLNSCYHLEGTVNAIYNPDGLQDGRIYVPDDKVDALKAATG